MSTFYQTGYLTTPIYLRCVDSYYENGSWEGGLTLQVQPGDDVKIFKSRLDRNFNNSTGYVTYKANDGTEFKLKFYINSINTYLVKNSMEITQLSGPWAPSKIEHTSGADATFTWGITQTASFYDAPVRAEDILTAEKCNLVPREKIWEYLAGRDRVKLADVLAIGELDAHAKLWCAVHPLFLTSVSKSTLTRELAKTAMRELSALSKDTVKHGDDMLLLNEHRAGAAAFDCDTAAYCEELDNRCLNAARMEDARQFELTSTLYGLLDHNLEDGWRKAVSCYIGFAEADELAKRQNTILELITKQL